MQNSENETGVRNFIHHLVPVALLISFAFLTGCDSNSAPLAPRLDVWSASEADVAKLGPEVDALGIKIRPPQGFSMVDPRDGPNGSKIVAWVGERRNDGSAASVQLMIVTVPESEQVPTAAAALDRLMGAVKRNRDSWNQSPTELGSINGLEFARVKWNAFEPQTMNPMDGYMYVAIDGDKLYQLATQDIRMYKDTALELSNASILSFKK
ncbi:MAG: hypothetical protein AB8B55_15110 [Mariniblastus sp.]